MKAHLPCPCGRSSDAYAIYEDGSEHCFSCDKHKFPESKENDLSFPEYETYKYVSFRGISERTMEKYNAVAGFKGDELDSIVYSYKSPTVTDEEAVGKVRYVGVETKKGKNPFSTFGKLNDEGLYGKHVHTAGSLPSITIFEGQDDALTGDTVFGDRSACLSVQSASTALRDIKKDREYINSFDKIIFWFDNDQAGKEALDKVIKAGLFDFNKMFIVGETSYKDANDYLQADERKEIFTIWKSAKKYTPDGIISTFSEIENALNKANEDQIGTYPFETLQHNLFGLHRGEVIIFKAPEGIGKTETFRAIEHHLLKTTDKRIGIIHLEEDDGTTIKAIATYELGVPCVLPDYGVTKKEIFDAYVKAVGNREDRVYMHSHFGADDPDVILDNIRFLTTVCGCDFIFLDHITMLVTGLGDDGDERRKLDYISTKLKLMAKEIGFCLVMISHVNDDGQTRGSRNITKIANTVVDIFRNKVADDIRERNTTYYTIEKARLGGRTGPGGKVFFDPDTYNMRDFQPTDHKPIEFKEFKAA